MNFTSQKPWNNLIGHLFAIQIPVSTVLFFAASIITKSPICEKDNQEDYVAVREEGVEKCRHRPAEGGDDLWDVVEMAGKTPPA